MIRVAIIDQSGKMILPKELSTAAELHDVVEQARSLIRECDRLVKQKSQQDPAGRQGGVPYL